MKFVSSKITSTLFKQVLPVVALLLTSQIVIAGGSHPHQWLIDTTVLIANATTVTGPQGNVVITDCFAEGEVRLRSRWVGRCPPIRSISMGVARWSDCPPSPWSLWWDLDDQGSVRIANAAPYPPPSNEYTRRYDIQYRPVQGQSQERDRYWNLIDFVVTNIDTPEETWTAIGAQVNYLAGEDGVLRIPNTWRIDGATNLGSFTAIGGGFTNENCGDPLPIEPDGEGGGTSTFPITAAAKDDKTDKKMYVVMKKAPAKSSKKKKQAEHAERYHQKRKQLVAEVARHVNKRPPSQKGKHERLCAHIQLADGERSIAVCGSKARNTNPKLWDARVKLWKWDQIHPIEEEAFGPPDTPLDSDGEPACYCSEVILVTGGLFEGDWDLPTIICEEGWMKCSQCDSGCD
ncbi:MAG: hypothetical protein AAEI92_03665 [Arenicellales bacterium]